MLFYILEMEPIDPESRRFIKGRVRYHGCKELQKEFWITAHSKVRLSRATHKTSTNRILIRLEKREKITCSFSSFEPFLSS